jgi:hypothetical protein
MFGVVLAQGVLTWVFLLFLFATIEEGFSWLNVLDVLSSFETVVFLTLWSVGVMALSGVLLLPVRKPVYRMERGTSLYLSVGVASLGIGVLCVGAVFMIVELMGLWESMLQYEALGGWLIVLTIVPGWVLFTPLLLMYARGHRRETFLGRVSAALCAGTVIEVLAAMPLDVMVRRRTDCYCAESTFLTFWWVGTVGLIAMGPAIVVPIVARRRRRWYGGRCEWCGYEMSGLRGALRCPECGLGWKGSGEEQKKGNGMSQQSEG